MATKTYRFEAMKGLTFWTLLFVAVRMVAMALYGLTLATVAASSLVDFSDLNLSLVYTPIYALYLATYTGSGIVSLIWIYGAARNALAMAPSLTFTPWGAVGWFFVPIVNLYKPYQIMKAVWLASGGPNPGGGEPRPVQAWWVFTIIGNIVFGVGSRLSQGEADAIGSRLVAIAGLGLIFVGTGLFFKLVRAVHALQLGGDTRAADAF